MTTDRVGGNIWALDKKAEVERLGLGEKIRRYRDETDRSRAGRSGQERTVFFHAYPLSAAWNEVPVSSLAANICEICCQIMCPFFFSLINLQKGGMK